MRAISAICLSLVLLTSPVAADETPGSATRGKVVYERYCITCHGTFGNGAGEFAQWITPKPRDFRQGTFKWRTTPTGSLPLVTDLERTVSHGVYGTNMPPWFAIGHRNRLDVIAYIQTFSPLWTTGKPAPPIDIPEEPRYSQESVTRGRAIYQKENCAACHGENAMGDGPSAHDLKDDWNNPILPYDLTQGHVKAGDTGPDIYRVFMTGLNGTPMPSFADSIKPDEAWDLVHYIQSLSPLYPKKR